MQTITPLEQSIGACSPIKPEWLRLPDAIRMSGLGRSTLYNLIGSGSIKSVVLRKRGNARGRRLINSDSLLKYIESFVEGGEGR
jgi:Helix-turn-helix domain